MVVQFEKRGSVDLEIWNFFFEYTIFLKNRVREKVSGY